ncbi:hypothetical protein PpBr36_03213 [Pyricularia pennisetigena]|uniref:hypothetical protein n=1 Tax=Pyricularia pennisetigena TaxID=1578925 RepID=UPI0011529F5D|nr:hypothetical protein PpBr36_03213 [Pyricularia pennisetigena]TLS30351.1 hypothetical protein PpBr36_03213 [Pyricularia pennisetigena]
MRSSVIVIAAALLAPVAAVSSYAESLPKNAQSLFTEAMGWMDNYYDKNAGYLYDFSNAAALRYETRSSAWYAFGLLARNANDDVLEAEKVITNIIKGQYKDPKDEWYGDYQQQPGEPMVGSGHYPATIYGSWDPNWRGFVGTTFIMCLEEFSDLISNPTKDLMLASLRNATKGDEYRFGNLDPKRDNLYPAYSNPSIMRAFMSGWTGRKLNEENMTRSGEMYAKEIIDLFNRADTLSEFNSGTYTGVSIYGLLLWSKYIHAENSTMAINGPRMLKSIWGAVSQLYQPNFRTGAGPWDRAYGYDENRYLSLMSLWIWTLVGKESSSLAGKPAAVMSHSADFAWAPLFAALAETNEKFISEDVRKSLTSFIGEHTFTASAFSPPFDLVPRNITTWMSDKVTIGAESFDEIVVGGPARSREAFNPAVIQWDSGDEISFITLWPTEFALDVEVSAGRLSLSYPRGGAASQFSLLVGTHKRRPNINGWEDLIGLKVNVSGTVNTTHTLQFAGAYGGPLSTVRDFEFWNFTYYMPSEGAQVIPNIVLDVAAV